MATVKTIAECLYMLTELIDLAITEQTVKVWEIGLKAFSDEQVQAATHHLIENWESSKSYNKLSPGDLKAIIVSATQSNWSEAWQEVLDKAHLFYSPVMGMNAPQWSSPMIEQAVSQFGGVTTVVNMLEKDLPSHRAQFRQIYEGVAKREQQKSTMVLINNTRPDFKVLEGGR
jgi:hypothetical protein